ncbi:hypothetical protein BBH51_07600 [Aggregatibacter actinomycetemcomitans]|uniref:DUF3262 domain-containing protein n=1 Tax=Aggregatibacter actinomycetemcomitans TaxID=714 RepID=A0A142G2Q7_AGGAC|nr:DUF3262 family protein [Aggregatibacter actinomycetemcomitans]KYK95212.1 hypothetical protein SA3733_05175 [Aggregatibacter actinomycetemcomitans serotype d str. SA3733]AMQ94937.1 hypothetical protein ACT75_10615 [Aggregatibacter actinomycetemcomitans]ANU82529.1 hypothetical protein BBH51_07600 [Aggregatibacter actinomycetemcomitans]EKX98253.1 integrating conjugative element protein, PFL_4701 family [Aggregatibacter actinomycetemcomitans Y4]KND86025.1 hypothetical protein H5P1_0200350 [Aggr
MSDKISPIESFSIASGIEPGLLKGLLGIILVAVFLLAYAWATQHGYKGVFYGNQSLLDYLKLVLSGAALLIMIVAFFVY